MKQSLEVADLFRTYGLVYREVHGHEMPLRHFRVMRAIEICRTAELGGHLDQCDQCGTVRISYHSCRNRHCPKCQSLKKERWLEAREKEMLPTSYFHIVFTLAEGLRPLVLRNQKVVYNLLFKSVSETLTELARDSKHLGAEIGFMAILHTWSQTLIDHPHLHCLVTGGGISGWKAMGLFEEGLLHPGPCAFIIVSRQILGWVEKGVWGWEIEVSWTDRRVEGSVCL